MCFSLVKKLLLLLNQTWSCIILNGAHLILLLILFMIVIMKLHTFWKKSNRLEVLPIQCHIGYLLIFLRNQALVLRLFTEGLDCLLFKVFQNQRFMLINL